MKKFSTKVISVLLCLAMLASILAIFSSCKNKEDKLEEKKIVIVEGGVSDYTLIRPDKIDQKILDIILDLRATIEEKSGCNIDFSTDWVKSEDDIDPSAKEILVGNTNRPETKEVLETLQPNSWAVVDKGNKVVICANNDALLSVAIDWFIENCINEQDKTVKITEKLVKTEGFGDGLAISIGGVSSYQVVYPKGNEMLEYYASLIRREAKVAAVVSDDKAATENEIVIGNTSRGSEVIFAGENEYSITTDGSKVFINASNEDALYFAVNYYIEHGMTITDTVISAPVDYNKSATLENYYADKSSKWDINLPYIEEGTIAPRYNIGTGLADDREKDTIIDSYMHVVSRVEYSAFENYAKKLESFGFKKTYSSKTENNDLWCYRLGAAYAYIHYAPLQKYIRVVWDRSSNCEVSDIEYVAEQTGTTTFYQYSINYESAKLNYSGINGWGLFDVAKLQDNSLIMVDGGSEASWDDKSLQGLVDFLYDITGTDKKTPLNIRLWYYTHSDTDHNGLAPKFINYLKSHGYKAPNIDTVAFNYPSARANNTVSKDGASYTMIEYMNQNYPEVNYLKLHTGMVLNVGEVKIEVIGTVESCVNNKGVIPNEYNTNCTSTVIRLLIDGKSLMLTGDIGRGHADYIEMYSADYFKSDILQVSHHGINTIPDFHDRCKAEYGLVPNGYENQLNRWSTQYAYFQALFAKDKLHFAGNYTTAIAVSNGKITVTKIPRYDNPTGKLDASIR